MLKIKEMLFSKPAESSDELLHRFKEQYFEQRDFVRSSIYWMINSNDIDDLVQETFLRAWRSFEKYEAKSSFRTWIYRIAKNVTYDYLKKNKETEQLNESVIKSNQDSLEYADLIAKGLMCLSVEHREAFSLHYQVGLTYLEISKLLEVPEGTIKSRANSAKTKFIKFLKENGVTYE